MKICIFGAGAIGGYMGAELALAGFDVTVVARGPHLAAMRERGLTLIKDGATRVARPRAVGSAAEAGPQDYVIVTLKAHSVPGIVEELRPLLGAETAVVPAVNGLPWWYFHKIGGEWDGRQLSTVDPGGKQWRVIGPERAIGCVVYPACEVPEPGVIQHLDGDRFVLGEPDGQRSARATALSQALIKANMKAPVRPNIRDEIWVKLWGNATFNPVSALTGATLAEIAGDPEVRALCRAVMLEVKAVGERAGARFAVDVEKRIDGAGAVGAHKTSMLQDLERGRPMEIDALVASVQEVARWAGIATPNLDAILALVRQRARVAGCYGR